MLGKTSALLVHGALRHPVRAQSQSRCLFDRYQHCSPLHCSGAGTLRFQKEKWFPLRLHGAPSLWAWGWNGKSGWQSSPAGPWTTKTAVQISLLLPTGLWAQTPGGLEEGAGGTTHLSQGTKLCALDTTGHCHTRTTATIKIQDRQGLISVVSPKVKVKFKEDRSNKAEVTLIYLH